MQPTLFDSPAAAVSLEDALLFALGEFQARGHVLAERELALDRLHHAIDRACDRLRVEPPSDAVAADLLTKAGAAVLRIPAYFAKRPYRVIVPSELASRSLTVYHQINVKLT